MIYYPEPDSCIRDKVKVVPELSNYATKKFKTILQMLIHLIYLL